MNRRRYQNKCRVSIDPFSSDKGTRTAESPSLDRLLHAVQGRFTHSLSPAAFMLAWSDWLLHFQNSPGKKAQLNKKLLRKLMRINRYAFYAAINPDAPACIEPLENDKRFDAAEWQKWPFNVTYQAFLLLQQYVQSATTGINGVSPDNEQIVSYTARQFLDLFAPSNFALTNPHVLERAKKEGGANFVRGFMNYMEDYERKQAEKPPIGSENFIPGQQVACTPGKVVYRNRLIELIQYEPQTKNVRPEPILFIPAWIMKYYILDLSPHNSLVKHLLDQGYTVFMISWVNPSAEDRDLGLRDYRELGIRDALMIMDKICPKQKVHAVGYCIGGTLLSIAASLFARENYHPFKSITLLAAQTDFEESGELMLFINPSQIAYLEDIMWERGYFSNTQMSGAFQLLRSNDLVFSRLVEHYLLGDREELFDLTAWNADSTRLPYKMHSQYLRRLFIDNQLAERKYKINDKPIDLKDIKSPLFVVGTVTDHIAPWKSVYKIHSLVNSAVTFILTTGGHNAGIISKPGHKTRTYQMSDWKLGDKILDPELWHKNTESKDGSWWTDWVQWLDTKSGEKTSPPPMGTGEVSYPVLDDAPGCYVHMR